MYHAFVAGLGVMGSACARALAHAGLYVGGCDVREPPHDRGSSHGESRIIRTAYFEDPIYTPLAQRALVLWRELESELICRLLRITGGLNIGPPDGEVVRGALASARTHDITCEQLNRTELMRRFPAISAGADDVAVFEPNAGILDAEQCVTALIESAALAGAQLQTGHALLGWQRSGSVLQIRTTAGECEAKTLVLALGAWLPAFRPQLPLRVTRQPVFWFTPTEDGLHAPGRLPHFMIEFSPGRIFYGFPDLGSGIKCAIHHEGQETAAETVDREIGASEIDFVRQRLVHYLPRAAGPLRKTSVCLYTNSPDGHFLIDRDPDDSHVWLLSACSGHGFKFAPALAELLAKAIVQDRTAPIEQFANARFTA